MRLPNLFIPTALLSLAVSADSALGQWTRPVAPSPVYTASGPVYASGTATYVSGTATAAVPVMTYAPATGRYQPASTPYYGIAPVAARTQTIVNGVYQAQRPTYFDNPSVYTGQPIRGSVQTSYQPGTQATNYSTLQAGQAATNRVVTAYSSPPITAPPITAPPILNPPPVTYAAAPPAAKREGCLSRFCNKLFGTGYTTSYYRAPVTYYRPVTTMNAATGAMVTVQQPCTSYEQQMQRNPFTTVLPGTTNAPNQCQSGYPCPPGANTCNTVPGYSQNPTFAQPAPISQTPYNGIGQVGATGTGDYQAMPIPSLQPSGTLGAQPGTPNLSPLTGPPPTLAPPTNTLSPVPTSPQGSAGSPQGSAGNDLAPVQRPTLNKPPTADAPTNLSSPQTGDSSQGNQDAELDKKDDSAKWRLQRAADSTAMIPRPTSRSSQQGPVSLKRSYGVAEPIRAPADYVAPYGPNDSVIEQGVIDQRQQNPSTPPAVSDPFSPPPTRSPLPSAAPSLPRQEANLSDWTEHSNAPPSPLRSVSYDRPVKAEVASGELQRSRHTVWTSLAN
jgi:hypothetical protein